MRNVEGPCFVMEAILYKLNAQRVVKNLGESTEDYIVSNDACMCRARIHNALFSGMGDYQEAGDIGSGTLEYLEMLQRSTEGCLAYIAGPGSVAIARSIKRAVKDLPKFPDSENLIPEQKKEVDKYLAGLDAGEYTKDLKI